MSSEQPAPGPVPGAGGGACISCRRRSWLLSQLSGPLEYCARDRDRLLELLALPDEALLQAVAGRRATELQALYERFPETVAGSDAVARPSTAGDPSSICRHRDGYPRGLGGPASPPMLHLAGGVRRLARLTTAPVVAVIGSKLASDYGMELARGIARGLSASGVTVAAAMTDGIAVAAHTGALDARGASVAVIGGGLDVSCPARRRTLYTRVIDSGCAICELPHECHGRRWGQLASERIIVELAAVTVIVEAEDTPAELAAARLAQTLGRTLAATPGRVSSPLSRGPHTLLLDGAKLIRGPQDVLELLYTHGHARESQREPSPAADGGATAGPLQPRLRAMLERVGCGLDTPDKLARTGADPAEVLLALSELELLGLLARGDGGRYLPRDASFVGG